MTLNTYDIIDYRMGNVVLSPHHTVHLFSHWHQLKHPRTMNIEKHLDQLNNYPV